MKKEWSKQGLAPNACLHEFFSGQQIMNKSKTRNNAIDTMLRHQINQIRTYCLGLF